MFKKLGEIAEERVPLLTVRCTKAWLTKDPGPTLYVSISPEMEVLTSLRERNEHIKSASPRLKEALSIWEASCATSIEIASPEHPLEVITGDIVLTLILEGRKYLLSVFRDIPPIGWSTPGGCPRNLAELLDPKVLGRREGAEEVLIFDKEGKVYNPYPFKEETEKIVQLWKLAPKDWVSVPAKELPAKGRHTQCLVIDYGGQQKRIDDINITIDPDTATVFSTIYWEVNLPIKLEDLRLFDGELADDGTLLNRSIRLTDEEKNVAAIFSHGHNILLFGWHLPSDPIRVSIT